MASKQFERYGYDLGVVCCVGYKQTGIVDNRNLGPSLQAARSIRATLAPPISLPTERRGLLARQDFSERSGTVGHVRALRTNNPNSNLTSGLSKQHLP